MCAPHIGIEGHLALLGLGELDWRRCRHVGEGAPEGAAAEEQGESQAAPAHA